MEVEEHVRFNSLRILTLSSDKERSDAMPPTHELAWDHDLVRTLQPPLGGKMALELGGRLPCEVLVWRELTNTYDSHPNPKRRIGKRLVGVTES